MKPIKTRIFAVLVSAIFLMQVYLLYTRPWWGPESRFPMTLVRSAVMPAVLGITAIVATFSAKASVQRNILYSIIIASAVQFIAVKIMLRFQQPALVVLILIASAFITFQLLQYGSIWLAEPQDIRRQTPSDHPTAKGVASISGIVLRLTIVAVVGVLGTYFMVGPEAFSEFGVITMSVLMLPIIILVILQQHRLRKTL
jgi:hypothetical protein